MKVLVVDDEQGIREIIREFLIKEQFEVIEASDGEKAIEAFKQHEISFIVLDVMLPKMDGWQILREIRKDSKVPVIMLTARGEEYDKLFGFELGVDDYMVKPFSPKELMARIKAVLQRSQSDASKVELTHHKRIQDFWIDFDAHRVMIEDQTVNLTPKEYDLLSFFVLHPGKVFSRDQLLDLVWDYEFLGDARTVDTHVKMLREHLGKYRKWVVTVWGVGYKFEMEA